MKKYFLLLPILFAIFLQIEFMSFTSYPFLRYEGVFSSKTPPLRSIVLSGPEAFYNRSDYETVTKRELEEHEPLPPSEIFEFESKISRLSSDVFSSIFFPWGIYRSLHTMYGNLFFQPENASRIATQVRAHINLNTEWKYRRFTLLVDGIPVDAMIVGRPSTLGNKRWMVLSIGITKVFECLLIDNPEAFHPGHPPGIGPLQKLLKLTNANIVLYNYPGMGDTGGSINKSTMQKVHEAILRFIEDRVQATEIIDYGHSFGGANQADTWTTHTAKSNIRYVLVKDRSPTLLGDAVENLGGRDKAIANSLFGWQINTVPISDNLKYPEIHIMSVKHIDHPMLFTDAAQIVASEKDSFAPTYGDTVIPYKASTAMHYLHQPPHNVHKVIIGVPDDHGATITEPTLVAEAINEAFEGAFSPD